MQLPKIMTLHITVFLLSVLRIVERDIPKIEKINFVK